MPNTPPDTKSRGKRARKGGGPPTAVGSATPGGDDPGRCPRPERPHGWARWRPWLIAIVAGLAGAAAFEPLNWRFLLPLAPLGGFWAAVRLSRSPRHALGIALAFGWCFYFGTLHWICSIWRFNFMAPLGVMLLGAYLAFYPAIAAWATRRLCGRLGPIAQFAVFATLWLIAEWLRTLGKLAVPLAQLGHGWATLPWAIQPASIFGELGVSLEVLLLSGILLAWIEMGKRDFAHNHLSISGETHLLKAIGKIIALLTWLSWIWTLQRIIKPRQWWLTIAATLLWILLFPVLGVFTALRWEAKTAALVRDPERRLNVALVQPNVPQDIKFESYASPDDNVRARLATEIATTQSLMLGRHRNTAWDLIVLPETAFVEWDFFQNKALRDRAAVMALDAGADLLFGAARDMTFSGGRDVFNSAYLVHSSGDFDPQVYDKMRLVPFGEALPYFDLIPGFQENVVGIGSFTPGARPIIFETAGVPYGVLICFESTFAAAAREFARLGARFLVVITNDAWYGRSAGAPHHHHLSYLRAVEQRRYVVRSANTGISSVIAPSGRAVASLGLEKIGICQGTIAPLTERTIFSRIGNAWLAALALAVLGAAALAARMRRPKIGPA